MTETDLVNTALTLIADTEITSIDDVTTEKARTCKRLYAVARDAALRAAHWNCATTRRVLANATSTYDQTEWDFVYQLPHDPYCLKARRFETPDNNWKSTVRFQPDYRPFRVEGRLLLCNVAEPTLIYTRRIENAELFDAELFQAIATLLASHLALAIRQDYKRNQALLQMWAQLRDEAMGVDESEGGKDTYISTDLVTDR